MDQQLTLQPSFSEQEYVPSSGEKKRSLMMYFLFGIIIAISNKKVSEFEFFHVKQAMWWWMVFILSVLVSIILLFLPIIKFLGILLLLTLMTIFVVLAKQARNGKYYKDVTKYALGIFPSLWSWVFALFGISFEGINIANIEMGSIENTLNQIGNNEGKTPKNEQIPMTTDGKIGTPTKE